MLSRRNFLSSLGGLAMASALPGYISPAQASTVSDLLQAELDSGRACGSQAAAIRATLKRLETTVPPGAGRTVVVDMPSQHLGAYEDGNLVLESRVVVGDKGWQTPDLDTRISFVRFNPTWTVPESILKARNWRNKVDVDPGYFSKLNFKLELDGSMVDPEEAAGRGTSVGRFVQQPGPGNALGRVKLGLSAGGAIYLHDTNDHGAFDEDARALSHGCIRVEEAVALAAWTLGISDYEAEDLVSSDDRQDRSSLPSPVRVVTTYFTAWPDASGNILYYPDIYSREGRSDDGCEVGQNATAWGAGENDVVTVYEDNAPPTEVIIFGN